MTVLFFEPTKPYTIQEREIESWKRYEDIYIKTDKGYSPACYYFPLVARSGLEIVKSSFQFADEAHQMAMKELFGLRNALGVLK